MFARLLGASGYGTLGALISTFIILQVPGSALQISVAREVSKAIARGDPDPGAGVARALRRLAVLAVAVTAIGILARDWIAAAIGVDVEWAAAAALPTGCLWLLLSVQRGALQGFQRYRAVAYSLVGENAARLVFGLLFYALGAGVTGAFLGPQGPSPRSRSCCWSRSGRSCAAAPRPWSRRRGTCASCWRARGRPQPACFCSSCSRRFT